MKKVLVVDDVPDNIELLRFDLEDDDFEVITASSGQECLKLAPLACPAIILLDIQMPGIDGIATLTRLKSNDITADIPVIMVSAEKGDDAIIQSLDLGAHDYVRKPIEYSILAARMRSALKLVEAKHHLEHANKELERLATLDFLTNTHNRRSFFNLAEGEFARFKRHHRDLSVIMLDADRFKSINDDYGHAAGDRALQALANTCRSLCRETDILSRLGGEEFALCCPETPLEGAAILAERIREACENAVIETDSGSLRFTVSIGITAATESDDDFAQVLNRADMLLYQAKHSGRNRTIASLQQPSSQGANALKNEI